ncbi:hypothetical protein [Streptomyces sp. H27-D2]|uniref:hypothetical protein n=1 Tax=Streptomyces sp. H27-D2 TaxID=3046304 RepID=UPI002DB62FA5|nr:hypothetical protein [Streptomyces sp. H27-D2]MEC4020550.1 hypothetical protein [Streptomyces sp. H27-D2]
MTKKIKGVEYADDEAEATRLLTAYCVETGFSPEWISKDTWDTTVRIACSVAASNGLQAAMGTLDADAQALRSAARREERLGRIKVESEQLIAEAKASSNLGKIIGRCRDAYVAVAPADFTYGASLTRIEFDNLADDWRDLGTWAGRRQIAQFRSFTALDVEDKAAKGKGQTGDTLETRGLQGNVLVTVAGVRFNVHINITGK